MIVTYAVETSDSAFSKPSVGAVVIFEFNDTDEDGNVVTEQDAWTYADEVLDGRWSSTTRI